MDINVQFSDAAGTDVLAYFSCPQEEDEYPNLGVVPDTDARWKVFYDSMPEDVRNSMPPPA
ncbi:hypothetical protein [Burkholderia cenocepacia]|uniref:hypothetical protein n=1 Tax=Burkholderia cenocepacia TaxID=95486 RepID=UPI001B91446E|nr:hypothetical protein [Burkholderia cenocepacia]MBR8136819.1 hypothetical protein [Burkholderia cenocepacia]